MKMRFATLFKNYGPVRRAEGLTPEEWELAVKEKRFMTVYHSETDWCTPIIGVVGHHGFVNTMCKLAFAKPLPAEVKEVIGLKSHQEAWSLCNE
jgi:hypothetical protein